MDPPRPCRAPDGCRRAPPPGRAWRPLRAALGRGLRLAAAVALAALFGCAPASPPAEPLWSTPPSAPTAAERSRAAAAFAEAQRILRSPAAGEGDRARAADLILEAATLGSPEAQMLLAATHLFRTDGARDPAAAVPWLARAAFQGQVEAQLQLARLALDGEGTRREPAWAALWFRRAAERGSAEAQFALALQQIAGIGATSDAAEALARLAIASEGGVAGAARYRDALRGRVPSGEAARALARVRSERAAGPVAAVDRPLILFVQYALAELGHSPGPIDGRDGPLTRGALAAFARQQGIAAPTPYDGTVIDRLRLRLAPAR
jgi:TPR repeat protein